MGCGEDSLEFSSISITWGLWVCFFDLLYYTNKWFCSKMPPRIDPSNANLSRSNAHTAGYSGENQFHNFMQMMMEQQQRTNEMMMEQQRKANEIQARLQEQMAKKDEELAQVQRQLLEVLGRRPEPVQHQHTSPQIVINNRDKDPNVLFKRFRKRGPKELIGKEDPLTADDWLAHTENMFDLFECTGKQQVHLEASMFIGLEDIWWKTLKDGYQDIGNDTAWAIFKEQFTDKYVPSHIKRQMAVEFQLLKQGDMTALQYVTKFERLSCYAPELVDTEEKKIIKFLEGLNPILE